MVVGVHLLAAIIYSLLIPAWEGFDELGHFANVRYVALEHRLPSRNPTPIDYDESAQPPLYYLLAGLLVAPLDLRHGPDPVLNDFAPSPEGGWNLVLHLRAEHWPWRGQILALHLVRLLSVALGTGAVLVSYAAARELWPAGDVRVLLSTSLVAFNPTLLALSAVVNNDSLVILLCFLVFRQLIRVVQGKWAPPPLLALTLLLAVLTKSSAAFLVPLSCLVLGWAGWRDRSTAHGRRLAVWAIVFIALGLMALAAALRQGAFHLGGSATIASGALTQLAGGNGEPEEALPSGRIMVELGRRAVYVFTTFWGSAGTALIGAGAMVYWFYFGLCLAAAAGLVRAWRDPLQARARSMLGFLLLLFLSAWVLPLLRLRLHSELGVLHGRFALVGLLPLALGLAQGLAVLPRGCWRGRLSYSLAGATAVLALAVPFASIRPVFAAAPAPTAAEVARISHRLDVDFDASIRLLGYDLPEGKVRPGGMLRVVLYWQCLQTVDFNALAAVHALATDLETIGRSNAHPDHGRFPTSLWRPGDVIREERNVRLERFAAAPSVARIGVSLYRRDPGLTYLTYPISESGRGTTYLLPELVELTGSPDRPNPELTPLQPAPLFGQEIALESFELRPRQLEPGGMLYVRTRWRALRAIPRSYTVFVHLLDRSGRVVAQGDGLPAEGLYPTTSWFPGEVVPDSHQVRLPAALPDGPYRLALGWYNTGDGKKLHLTGVAGDAVLLSMGLLVR